MDVDNSFAKETINFVENIEFSEFQLKTEIKKEEGLNQEVWKPSPLDVKPKLEQVEASEIGEAKIKTDETETLCTESLDVKDEFMWAMKDFVPDNDPTKNTEEGDGGSQTIKKSENETLRDENQRVDQNLLRVN